MFLRFLISAVVLFTPFSFYVWYNALGRMFSGHSIFSMSANLSWYGSWQAVLITLVIGAIIIAASLVYWLFLSGRCYQELRPKHKKKIHYFLRRAFRLWWQSRQGKNDRLSQSVVLLGKVFSPLVKV